MKVFKNKFLWKTFVSILVLPAIILFGIVIFSLFVGGIIGINPLFGNYIPMIIFIIVMYISTVYKIFTDKFED